MDTAENKKVILEDLSKEDLIKKCKTLLTLAQKARASRESLQEENNVLKKQLNQPQQNNASNELLERLTNEKLLLVTEIEDLNVKNKRFQKEIELYKETQEKLETEKTSYTRQIQRLTDENEQLITDLSTLEVQVAELHKLGIEQKGQLLKLEKANENSLKELQSSSGELLKLNHTLKNKDKEISELFQELQALKIIRNSSSNDSNKNCDKYVKEINELKIKIESYDSELLSIKGINEKLKDKVTLYHSKLKKFALAAKQIKEEKNQVIKIFKAYTEQIKEWKEQLLNASEQLVKLVNHLEQENHLLKEEKKIKSDPIVCEQCNEMKIKLAFHENELKLLKVENNERNNQILESTNKYNLEIDELKDTLLKYKAEVDAVNLELSTKVKLLDEATEAKKNAENEIQGISHKYNLEIEHFKDTLLKYKAEVDAVNQEILTKVKLLDESNEAKKNAENENIRLNEIIQNYSEKLDSVSQDLVTVNQALKDSSRKYEEENQYLNESLIATKEEINKLNEALKQSLDTEKLLAEKSSEEILRLVQSNKELEEKCSKTQDEFNTISRSYEHISSQTDKVEASENVLEENGIDLRRENSELLLEMNQMNQALKERGEIISKLEAHCDEIKKKLQLYETQANKNVDSIAEKEETIRSLSTELESLKNGDIRTNIGDDLGDDYSKDIEISNLKAEIEALKDKYNGTIDASYAESETMSTSTISKCEEANRLKDLEGSWEERYGKLRTLAIKLKAKIREQVNIINTIEKDREELHKKYATNLKTVQNLQAQIDNLQDDLDKSNTENKQYVTKLNSVAENISKDKQLLVQNEETISNLNKEIEKFNKDKQSLENWKKQVGSKIQTLRKELEAKNVLLKESENQVAKLENELENKTSQLKIEQESHKQTRGLLDQTSNECKKNSVLNLEMQDYERSVKELSQKIDKQSNEIGNLQTQLDIQKNTVNALREQNKILEERIAEEEKSGNSSSLELSACKKSITNLEDVLQQKEDKILSVTKLLETTRSENEELSTELSKVIAEHQKSINMVRSERDQLRNQILSIQQTLRNTQEVLKLREDELRVIKEDYETYKVRAQSVLKKNQNRDLGLEEKLSEELTTVRTQYSKLNEELKNIRKQLEKEHTCNEILTKERDGLVKKYKELETEVEELKNYSEQLGIKHQKATSEHAETVRNLKVHAETLSQCYRQQLSEQEVRHNREIIELQSRLDKAPSPVDTVPHPNMPREEGEGSESIESNAPPNNVHPIPLERLLDSKSDDELMHLKKMLVDQESKVVHLTALLSDTEQDLVKHVQMNKVLKEEIRRQQRSVEREKHAENLEYLKNVVFKFVTLNSGDERTRLVPVLNTILKLSPEETNKLAMVAKGDPGIKGWTSYLPTWSSPNKPQ